MGPEQRYWPRIADGIIERKLSAMGAVSIQGLRGCGKTATAERLSGSSVHLSDSRDPNTAMLARIAPSSVLKGEQPRLLDDWPTVPLLWNAVKFEADEGSGPGMYLLTGSHEPRDRSELHPGSGRFGFVTMRPMSLYESRESKGAVSLSGLFDGRPLEHGKSALSLKNVADIAARGGWPEAVVNGLRGHGYADRYVESVCRGGISMTDSVKRSPVLVRGMLRSIAKSASSLTSLKTITAETCDLVQSDGESVTYKTVSSYYNALKDVYVSEDVPPCGPSARSRTPMRESGKRQLADPSLIASLLGLDADRLMTDLRSFGSVFESLCDRDLRAYAEPFGGTVGHYHDSNDLEVDAIVETRDGRWGAIEMKLGGGYADDGAKNLNRLEDKIVKDGGRPPVFKMVLTSTGYAYKRDDGVIVVPIGCLGP